ncbi:organomercurial lyase MerB [Geomonas azotofigens]|uniref:organomercurial lyase MerB n=1 Tax=Geomonas azotofigens TaxID=2843196 RepID=UPI001C0F506B|nr:organomercurial lyase MerB [Geomonas azotofigens]MBU5614931.1 organomercurial lyase MerB [Geomonas azotofigens]
MSIDLLEERLLVALHCCHPRFWLHLLRTLAKGKPVTKASIAAALDMALEDIDTALMDFKDTVYDGDGNVVACGLSLVPTSHRFSVDGCNLFTWCALDALMYPVALRQVALVESQCPVTGVAVRLTVTPTGITALTPVETVVSLVVPAAQAGCCNVRNAFCSQVHFMSSLQAADEWRSTHPHATILSVEEAWRLGSVIAQRRLADVQSCVES